MFAPFRCYLPQSSSASRLTAGTSGFLHFSKSIERPERWSELRGATMKEAGDWQQARVEAGP
jgi:hypothetical protein